jgi:hypothetical protein
MKKLILIIVLLASPALADMRDTTDALRGQYPKGGFSVKSPGDFSNVTFHPDFTANGYAVPTQTEFNAIIADYNSLAKAKARRIKAVKKESRTLLREHGDWAVLRAVDPARGNPIPQNIRDYITAVVAASNTAESAINALSTVAEVRDYAVAWPMPPGE